MKTTMRTGIRSAATWGLLIATLLVLNACVSLEPATRANVEKAVKAENLDYLQKVVDQTVKTSDAAILAYAKENFLKLKAKSVKARFDKAIKDHDNRTFEAIAAAKDQQYLSAADQKTLTDKLTEIKRNPLYAQLKTALDASNLIAIERLLASADAAYLYPADKVEAIAKLNQYIKPDSMAVRYQDLSMDARVRRIPKDLQAAVFIDPDKNLAPLVTALIGGESDPYMKAKLIHDWICDNVAYDSAMFLANSIVDQDMVHVLKKKMGVCSGYATLFQAMAKFAGMSQCAVITGNAKTPDFSGNFDSRSAHAWNAININHKWYLVDCTWDAGNVSGAAWYFQKKYSTAYLFIDARANLYSHFPDSPAQQFFVPVLTKAQFQTEPFLSGRFFQFGLDLASNNVALNNQVEAKYSFSVRTTAPGVQLGTDLRLPDDRSIPNTFMLKKTKPDTYTIDYSIPTTGRYKGNLFARKGTEKHFETSIAAATFEQVYQPQLAKLVADKTIGDNDKAEFLAAYTKVPQNGQYYYNEDLFNTSRIASVQKVLTSLGGSTDWLEGVLSVNIKNLKDGPAAKPFPYFFSNYGQKTGEELLAPLTGSLQVGSKVMFRYQAPAAQNVGLIVKDQVVKFPAGNNGIFEFEYEIPNLEQIQLAVDYGDNRYWSTVAWTVEKSK